MLRRRSTLVIAAIVLVTASRNSLAIDIKGSIVDGDGKPIEGATAYIYTAAARRGTSTYCPGCYLDCGKTAKSDAAGQFVLEALDPTLVFQVLFIADGYKPAALKKVDPMGPVVTATLERRPTLPDDPKRVIRGRVLNEQDEPIAGATIEVSERRLPGGITTGYPQGIDLVVFSDANGEFVIVADEPVLSVSLLVQAKDAARKKFADVTPAPKTIWLTRGHHLTGRVVQNGKPVTGAVVGLAQVNRSVDDGFVGEFTAETNKEGVYHFYNVPPNDSFCLYGKMASLTPHGGGIEVIDVKSGKDDAATTLDDLELKPAHTLVGRLTRSDGGPVPPGTRVLAGREKAWDTLSVEADEQGNFRFEGLPTEAYSLSASIPGYRVSAKNKSLDVLNRRNLKGLVDCSYDKLVMLFEPGEPERPNYEAPEEERQAMFNAFDALDITPLRGAE